MDRIPLSSQRDKREITEEDVKRVLIILIRRLPLLQNEISSISEIIDQAKKQGLTIFLNPAQWITEFWVVLWKK